MKNKILMIVIAILLFLMVGAGSFYCGMKFQQKKTSSLFNRRGGGQNFRQNSQFPGGMRQGFRPVSGEIIDRSEKSITVKLNDNSSKIILFSDKTAINKASQGTQEDLKTGEKVMVFGQENNDGSITAQNIQLGEMIRN